MGRDAGTAPAVTEVHFEPPRCQREGCRDLYQDHLGDQPGELEIGGACTQLDCECPGWLWLGD